MRTRSAMHYNPSCLRNHHDEENENATPTLDHILWHEEANEFIKHLPKKRYKNDTVQQQQQQQQQQRVRELSFPFSRHSTGGGGGGSVLYTHPSAIAMMTLNKRASHDGRMEGGRESGNTGFGLIVPENNGLVGNELLTARQRHQRDLFSGDLGIPPIPPPPPPLPLAVSGTVSSHAPRLRTHVGNVVHTFETLAMQRRLAAFKQHEQKQQQQQQQQQKPQFKIKNTLQKLQQNNTVSKYLKSNKIFNTNNKMTEKRINNNSNNNYNFLTKIKCNNNTTFNERNKEISQQFLKQMDIDYRKNLFSSQSHVNNSNKNYNNIITHKINNEIETANVSEGEAGVVARFDEMLAGYSTTAGDDDDDDAAVDNYDNCVDYDDMLLENNARVSIININSNEAQDNVWHINLSSTNGKPTTTTTLTTTSTDIKQFKCSNTNQRLLPIMRKKPAPPLPPPKPLTKTTTIAKQQHELQYNMLNQHHHKIESKCAVVDNTKQVENNEFLRGTTLSQSFVCHSNWQQRKKPKAPKPPILPITTPNVQNITKQKSNTQLRIAITNPFRHVLRLNSKRSNSFNLLKPNDNAAK